MKFKFLFIVLLSMLYAGCSLFRPTPAKLFKRALKNQPYDVVIVPGVPFDGNSWSMAMRGRVIWASYLVNKGIAKNVIFSGGAVYTPYIEA